MALTPGTDLGPFEIVSQLGAGGMGEVFRARDTKLGREVALKVLPDALSQQADRLARFRREAQVLAALNHPNIAAIFGLEEARATTALVLELVEGPTLLERLRRGPIPIDEALPIARQIADALQAAHEKSIVHRDLKPANIKVTIEGRVKVLDFGLAKIFDEETLNPVLSNSPTLMSGGSMPGIIIGTAGYMSPEQSRGKTVDSRTDVWAFGVLLFEMLTGHSAFGGETMTDILGAIVHKEVDWRLLPSGTPAPILRLLRRCLAKDPNQRLHHIADARIEIDAALHAPAEESAAEDWHRAPALGSREAAAWGIASLGVLLLVSAFIIWSRSATAPVIQFLISLPENSRLRENAGAAISPDGRSLAFVAADSSGKDVLWIRRLEKLEPAALTDTEGAYYPFWSPDSQFIAFFAKGKLRRIAVSGGASQTITDVPRGGGGSWNPDGVILFVPTYRSSLYRIPADGGASTLLESAAESPQFPSFLPDGDHFVFHGSSSADKTGIYLGSLSSKETFFLLKTSNSPGVVTKEGYLLFAEDGILKGQKLNVNAHQLEGHRFPIGEKALQKAVGVGAFPDSQSLSVSSSGTIAYLSGNLSRRQLAWFDRSGHRLGTVGEPGNYVAPSLSPDETMVAVGRDDDIWVMDLTRQGLAHNLTLNAARELYPFWSRDGRYIAYTSDRDTTPNLYQKLASGTGPEEILLKSLIGATEWSPDGRFITYFTDDSKNGEDLFMLPMSGDRKPLRFLQSKFAEYENRLSPDGKWMAYVSEESGTPEVVVETNPRSEKRWTISATGGTQPIWRSNGKELFYLALDGNLMAADIKTTPTFEASIPKVLFKTNTQVLYCRNSYEPTLDGQRFLVNSYLEGDNRTIAVLLNASSLIPH